MIDNFDSFTFNLVHYIEQFCEKVTVKRNNEIKLNEIEIFDKIVFSPGPGLPGEVPVLNEIIRRFGSSKPIMGVCLGHQAIAECFGGELLNLVEPCHGKQIITIVTDKSDYLFKGIPDRFESGRYHSWVVNPVKLPKDLIVTSIDETGNIMSVRHGKFDIRGVQFHPESVMTGYGMNIIANWAVNTG